jgi:hypothetical protein
MAAAAMTSPNNEFSAMIVVADIAAFSAAAACAGPASS